MSVTLWLDELRDDLKFAFRQLRHSPAFTLVATLTLALGIGANSAIFALVDATLLRPLPYREPDRLVAIWETHREEREGLRVAAQHDRLGHAQPQLREDRRLHAERRRDGDGRRRRQRRNRLPPVGHLRHLRRARRHADRGPHVLRRRRGQARERRRAERAACGARGSTRDPGVDRPRAPSRRHGSSRSSASFPRTSSCWGRPACGRCDRS